MIERDVDIDSYRGARSQYNHDILGALDGRHRHRLRHVVLAMEKPSCALKTTLRELCVATIDVFDDTNNVLLSICFFSLLR